MQLQQKVLHQEHLQEQKRQQKRQQKFYKHIHSVREEEEEFIDTERSWHRHRRHPVRSPDVTDTTIDSEPIKDSVDVSVDAETSLTSSSCSTPDRSAIVVPRPHVFLGAASSAFLPTPAPKRMHSPTQEEAAESLSAQNHHQPKNDLSPLLDSSESEFSVEDHDTLKENADNNNHMTPPRATEIRNDTDTDTHTPKTPLCESEKTKSAKNKYNWLKSTYDRVYRNQRSRNDV